MLILQRPWDSQPQDAVAPSANWAGRLTQLSVGGSFYNLATGLPETKYGAMARATSAAGASDAPTLSGNDWVEAVGPGTSDFAIVSVFVPQSVTGLQQIVAADPVSDAVRQFQLRANGTSLEFIRFITTAATFTATISAALQIGRPVCIVSVSSGQTISLYTGDKSASATTGGTTQVWTKDALRSSWFMRRVSAVAGAGSEPSSHLHALRAVIRGAISNAEALSLVENPWQLFEPRRIYIPTAAGGPATHAATGALATAGAAIAGSAARIAGAVTHAATGALATAGAAIAGASARTRAHPATGSIAAAGAAVAGTAKHNVPHPASGALATAGAVLAGAAARSGSATAHAATGSLAAAGAALVGAAAHVAIHSAAGALATAGASIAGSAARAGAVVTHAATGALAGDGATMTGTDAASAFIKYFDVLSGRLLILRAL